MSFPGGRPQPQPWVPQNDPSPPLDPYGARGGALYAHPVPMGTEAITRSFAELNIARGQNSTRSPAYSQSSMAMVRPGQSSMAQVDPDSQVAIEAKETQAMPRRHTIA